MFKRIAYFFYYLKELDRNKFVMFVDYVHKQLGRPKVFIYLDAIVSVFRYNISLLEYFQFRFFEIEDEQRVDYAGTGYMYEYQLKMNPKGERHKLSDKILFLDVYKNFVKHEYASLNELEKNPAKGEHLLKASSGKLVLKASDGQCGKGIEIIETKGLKGEDLIQRLKLTGNDYAEAFVQQHDALNELSPSGLNTLRVITQLNSRNEPEILGIRLRITVNSFVDNLAAGNIAASVDPETGKVNGPGVYSDITKSEVFSHPLTGVPLIGFQIPYWSETMTMIRQAALTDMGNRSIGWDVAITSKGPELIEGNHDWCKLLWQLPVKKGLKPLLKKYLQENEN